MTVILKQRAHWQAFVLTSTSLHYAVTHVFFPVELPRESDYTLENGLSLARAACAAAHAYSLHVHGTSEPQWHCITKMLDNLQASIQSEHLDEGHVISQLREMQTGAVDILTFFIQPQNAAVFLTKRESCTLFESFEVSPSSDAVMIAAGCLICSYPGSAVEIPNEVFDDGDFQFELANFLTHPNAVDSDIPPPPPARAQYITALLTGILRSVGCTVDGPRITKRVRDHVGDSWSSPWRRSSLWLLIRVAIQTSVARSPLGRASYKRFMLFFICSLARDANNINLSSDLLHLMSCKILRRLNKLGSSTDWLSDMALQTCAYLGEILDARLEQLSARRSLFRNPSRDDLIRDTQLSLSHSGDYIRNALANRDHKPLDTLFHPNHHRRGTIDDFLSSNGTFFEEEYDADPKVTLYDVEQSVEQGIDDWFASVTNVEEACAQLEILMDKYMIKTSPGLPEWHKNPEGRSIMFLTAIELFVVLDKLVMKEIPMLADYSPEIPIAFLEKFSLRKAAHLHRLSRAYQYLSVRQSQSRPGWSILSNAFTKDSFPVRYYDESPHLQYLKARIEEDAVVAERAGLDGEGASLPPTCDGYQENWQDVYERRPAEGAEASQSPLPASPLHAKVVVFELQCPACLRGSYSRNNPTLRYAARFSEDEKDTLSVYDGLEYTSTHTSNNQFTYRFANDSLKEYGHSTSHTSNDVLSAQADCPPDLSLDEFIAFSHLRSGGSLQWLNILRGLRSRSLNFRRHDSGPLNLNTAEWIWHQELQESSFCDALLDELDNLIVEVGASSIDGVMMNTISLLLTRVLASSPSEGVSERVIALLRSVRRKTFSWVQELSYNLEKAPMNGERSSLLQDMAATCRSTFDVDLTTLHKTSVPTIYASPLNNTIRLSLALEGILRDVILADTSDYGVDLAVSKIFPSHRPSAHKWQQLQHQNARWLTCGTKVTGDQPSQTMHLNLLSGELRLDGQPLDALLRAMRGSPQFQKIFCNQGLYVIPSNLPGMDFMTLPMMSKQKVHFSLRGDNLVVRMQCDRTNHILELIPSSKLEEDLPPALVNGYVHWLNLSTKIIEICPLELLWEQSSGNWRIDCAQGQFRIYKGCETLVDIRSPTWAMISKCFECLNNVLEDSESQSENLLITMVHINSLQSERLSVVLPLYGLSFFINEQGELESRDFKDMVYDGDQCVKTLFGLENLLVLRQKTHLAEGLIPRLLLIPHGFLKKHGDQVQVGTHWHRLENKPLSYHTYIVDTELGCLIGNDSLTSMQHLANLHAETSCHRRDPLTGKTGAQAALCLVQSARCRSIMKLRSLYGTSPRYPQIQAAWDEIQHRYYWNRSADDRRGVSTPWQKRAMRRAAYLFLSNVTVPTPPGDCEDMDYFTPQSDLELQDVAFTAASAVYRWSTNGPTMDTISNWAELWSNNNNVHAAASPSPNEGLGAWLNLDLVETLMIEVHAILENWEGTGQHFQLLFLLPAMAYCSPCHQAAFLSMLVAFARQLQPHSGNLLIHVDCKISDGYRPTEEVLRHHIRRSRLKERCGDSVEHVVDATVKSLLKDWPYDAPLTFSLDSLYWDVKGLTARLQQLFSSCYRNFKLKEHLTCVLTEHRFPTLPWPVSSVQYISNKHTVWPITLDQLLSKRPVPELPTRSTLPCHSYKGNKTSSGDASGLNQLFCSLRTDSSFQREYLTHLAASAQRAHEESQMTHRVVEENRIEALRKHYAQCRVRYMGSLAILRQSLSPTDPYEQALDQFGQWPPITADVLLRYLASTSPIKLPGQWKKCLVSLALLLLDLQRSRRLLRFALDGREEEFSKELENKGCDGWNPEDYPDWLLIQVQGNFLIRRVQAETAMEMISPRFGGNTVMQVNMGEGKSSVIIPIAAAALADGKQLIRVIVPKALTVQMFELLVDRLGGLANRPIYHLPFSRTPEYDTDGKVISLQIDDLRTLMSQCMAERGILLVQPEHVVSLKLMSQSGDAQGASDSASKWLGLQKWIHSHVRDILDESDEILHPRFQLIYTIGQQQHMDGYPDRWTISQQVLRLVKKHADSLSRYAPDSMEYECGPPGSFPHVRIAPGSNAGRDLISLVVKDVVAGRLPNFNFPGALHNAIHSFISDEGVIQVPDTAKRVEEYAKGSHQSYLWSGLLLLRGLLASNILLFTLAERRWRVDYGLDPQSRSRRTMLAVPYRAKDVPAPNTQFGHPDITIILTCLSYYYTGLTEEQLRVSFETLLDQDDPSTEYALWLNEYDCMLVPHSLQKLGEINLKSSEQWDNVTFPLFARNQAAIDFYLSRVVFPKEAKEFPWKISGSSWDLAEKREKVVTGFSGTNDGRWLLPTSITQRDLDHQEGTNARVLTYLLQPENNSYVVAHERGERWITLGFLRMQVAKAWLDIIPDIAGAIYFNENDELMMLTRDGNTQPMLSSPLSQQLDRCVVYLDHAHTRGTDIKLPIGSRAAVTLGPKVTKDSLVQGCMRMRKLGHGHSVTFFAPPEVDRSIRAATGKKDSNIRVSTVDILCWAIHETWADIQQRAPHWAQQGMSHKSRHDAWIRFRDNEIGPEQLSDEWLRPELKSLADLYGPCETKNSSSTLSELDPEIRQRCKDLEVLSLPNAQMEEEQEREVNSEREREREVELPPKAEPMEHFLHPDVVRFVNTGDIPPFQKNSAFHPVFTTLKESSAATGEADVWSPFILATADFCKTIKPDSTQGTMDQYLRPVQWILSRKDLKDRDKLLVLLSPFEANCLMPDIRASEHVHLHVYAPRTSQRMKPSDNLKLYSIPPLPSDWNPPWVLIDQLNMFAGQLYLRDYKSYLRICRFLGVLTKELPNDIAIRWNLFKIPGSFEDDEIRFSASPLPSVMALFAVRNRGRPFAQTHMGKILQGQILTERDIDGLPLVMPGYNPSTSATASTC
ncbi:hypothetical protein J3R83DRAFT_9676 [Lanmaoa asiatica]|nr:hypothetical protein J3R83DRAFT_9676 [Lanmaoa asiatica]